MAPKLTPLRREILSVVQSEDKPLSAKQIMRRMLVQPNLSSIYRSLEYLVICNLLQSVSFSGIRHYFIGNKGKGHFIICKGCKEMITFDECIAEKLQKRIQERYHYTITDHVLYFEGFCTECRSHFEKREKTKEEG
jgi:Fur family ferric uptake transcriptional regulator